MFPFEKFYCKSTPTAEFNEILLELITLSQQQHSSLIQREASSMFTERQNLIKDRKLKILNRFMESHA